MNLTDLTTNQFFRALLRLVILSVITTFVAAEVHNTVCVVFVIGWFVGCLEGRLDLDKKKR